jgi:restriction system protein
MWLYKDGLFQKEQVLAAISATSCVYCGGELSTPHIQRDMRIHDIGRTVEERHIRTCRGCGWWTLKAVNTNSTHDGDITHHYGSGGRLMRLDTPEKLSVEEVRSYLTARFSDRHLISPSQFEDVVASVFRDHGYDSIVTGKTGDGGIDIVLQRDGQQVGVQVKRYKDKIGVDPIRSFMGALTEKGLLAGVFVTTSDFTKGAREYATAPRIRERLFGEPIRLVNAAEFYGALKIAQIDNFSFKDDASAPFNQVKMMFLETERPDVQ